MRIGVRTAVWSAALSALLVAIVVLSAGVGPVALSARVVAMAVLDAVPGLSTAVPESARVIVVTVRLPRILLGAGVGFALAAAGTVMQGFFRNPMADPSIIGVSSGAAVGAVAVIALGIQVPYGLPVAAFVGGVLTAFAVYAIATTDGRTPVATLLLAGVAVQTFLGAVTSFMLLQAGESLERAVLWLMGHLQNATWTDVQVVAVSVPVLFVVLLAFSRDLNVLLLGEEEAHSLGVEVETTKRLLLAVSSLVTAAAVAVSGVIGFVGLIVPHGMRLLVGPDHRILLPTSALAGASFLVAADTLARSGAAELPVGVVTAAVGAPFFLYLLTTREVHAL
jgi:iron complex transport system permease protein